MTPNNEIKTFYRSYIDHDLDGFTLSGDFENEVNATDRKKTSFAITSGFDADTIQTERVTIDVVNNSTLYSVTINGTACEYTSDGSAIPTEIHAGLEAAVIASGEPVTLGSLDSTGTPYFDIVADIALVAFTIAVSTPYLSVASETTEADFIADMTSNRSIDTIAIKSNMSDFKIYYWDGSAYVLLKSYTANTDTFLVYSFTAISSSKIKLVCRGTMTPDEEKKIYLFDITKAIASFEPEKVKVDRDHVKANLTNIYGGSVQIVKYPNNPKISVDLTFKNLQGDAYTAYALLKSKRLIDSFIVYLYMTDLYTLQGVESWHLVNDIAEQEEDPAKNNFASGVSGKMKLREC